MNRTTYENDEFNFPDKTLEEIIVIAISIFAMMLNLVVVVAIIRGPRSLQKPMYKFVASLAIADLVRGLLLTVTLVLPVVGIIELKIIIRGMAVSCFIVALNSLALLAFDRCMRIKHSMYSRYEMIISRKFAAISISLSWAIAVSVFVIAPLFGWSCSENCICLPNAKCACTNHMKCTNVFAPFTKAFEVVILSWFMVMCALMLGFYAAVYFRIHYFHNMFAIRLRSRDINTTKTLAFMSGVFVMCWTPMMVLIAIDANITYHNKTLDAIFDYSIALSIFNSLANPVIYSIRLTTLGKAVRRILCPCKGKQKKKPQRKIYDSGRSSRSESKISRPSVSDSENWSYVKVEGRTVKRVSTKITMEMEELRKRMAQSPKKRISLPYTGPDNMDNVVISSLARKYILSKQGRSSHKTGNRE